MSQYLIRPLLLERNVSLLSDLLDNLNYMLGQDIVVLNHDHLLLLLLWLMSGRRTLDLYMLDLNVLLFRWCWRGLRDRLGRLALLNRGIWIRGLFFWMLILDMSIPGSLVIKAHATDRAQIGPSIGVSIFMLT